MAPIRVHMYTNSAPIPILTSLPHWIHSFFVRSGLDPAVPGCVTSSHIDLFCCNAILSSPTRAGACKGLVADEGDGKSSSN